MTNFDYVSVPKPKESGFDLSYSNKLTMDMGDIVPVFKQEVLPGDEIKAKAQFMVRMAPLANPIFTKIDAQIHYFFVPNRLLWNGSTKENNWETFITGGKDGTAAPTPPYLNIEDLTFLGMRSEADTANARGAQTLADYLGVPLLPTTEDYDLRGAQINMLPFLAYQKIYDDWFRDPNITNSLFDAYEEEWLNGGDIYDNYERNVPAVQNLCKLRKRAWKKDYFTSALPWAQRGPEAVIPSGTLTCTVYGGDGSVITNGETIQLTPPVGAPSVLSSTIRDLRNASAVQLWLEKNAIGGGRYIEQLLSHFGIYSDDARLQRAEYLGSVKSPIVISEVQATANSSVDGQVTYVGELAGKGVGYGNDFGFDEKFKEHGWVIGVMTIMPEATYAQGIHRSLTHRMEKLDYAFPEFSELGLAEINMSEIYYNDDNAGTATTDVFGYQDRYGEYKSNYNEVHGLFKDETETLAQYNMTRFYNAEPELSASFIEVREQDITSPFVDTEKNRGNFWVDIWNDVVAVRPLPKNSVPLF